MFNDPAWRKFSSARTKAIGAWPNELWHNATTNAGALVVTKSPRYDEFALSKAALDYLVAAARAGRVTEGKVILVNGSVVAEKPVIDVAATLEHMPPRDGRLGPYWWMRPDLTPDGYVDPRELENAPY